MSYQELISKLTRVIKRKFPLIPSNIIFDHLIKYANVQNYSRQAKTKLVTYIYNLNHSLTENVRPFRDVEPHNKNVLTDPKCLDAFIPFVPPDIQRIICDYGYLTRDDIIPIIIKTIIESTKCHSICGKLHRIEIRNEPFYHLNDNEKIYIEYSSSDGFMISDMEDLDKHVWVVFTDNDAIIAEQFNSGRVPLRSYGLIDSVIKFARIMETRTLLFLPVIVKLVYLWRCYTMSM